MLLTFKLKTFNFMKFKILFFLLFLFSSNLLLAQTDLVIQLTAPSSIGVGQPLTYQVTVSNNGPVIIPTVYISSTIPDGCTNPVINGCTASGGATCPTPGLIYFTGGTPNKFASIINTSIPVGGSITFSYTVTSPMPSLVSSLTATATIDNFNTDIDPVTNTSTVNTTIPISPVPNSDIEILKTANINNNYSTAVNCNPGPVVINYTVKFINKGPSDLDSLSGMSFTDAFSMKTRLANSVNHSFSYTVDLSNVNWNVSSANTSLTSYPTSFSNNGSNLHGLFTNGYPQVTCYLQSGYVSTFKSGDTITLTYTATIHTPIQQVICQRDSVIFTENSAYYSQTFGTDPVANNNISQHRAYIKCIHPTQCPPAGNVDVLALTTISNVPNSPSCSDFPKRFIVTNKFVNNCNKQVTENVFQEFLRFYSTSSAPNSSVTVPVSIISRTVTATGTSTIPAIELPNFYLGPDTINSNFTSSGYGVLNFTGVFGYQGIMNPFDTIITVTEYEVNFPTAPVSGCGAVFSNIYIEAFAYHGINVYVDSFLSNNTSVTQTTNLSGSVTTVDLTVTRSVSNLILNSGDTQTMTTIFSNANFSNTVGTAIWRDTLPEAFTINLASISCNTNSGSAVCGPITYDSLTRILTQTVTNFPPNSSLIITYNGVVNSPVSISETSKVRCSGDCTVDCTPNTNFSQTNYQITAALPACIGNKVWNDINHDGIQNNGEVGVAGITTSLINASTNSILETVTTDAYGFYQFCELSPGSYKIGFSLPANYIITNINIGNDEFDSDPNLITGITDTYTLLSGDSNMSVDAGIYQPLPTTASIGNKVWFDMDSDGIQDITEQGVSGITVSLYNCINPTIAIATTITDANGLYLFENLLPGNYSIGFSAPLGVEFTTQNGIVSLINNSDADNTGRTTCISVMSGDTITYVDAGIVPQTVGTASLGDKIWNDANQNGIQDANETGVNNIVVTLYDATGTTVISSTTTNALGFYSFNDLTPGCYIVGFGLPVGYSRTIQNVGTDSSKNSDANDLTGLTNQICLSANQNNPTIDAGIFNPTNTNSIGDKVWYDQNKNGLQDPNEYGYPGVLVTLFDCSTNSVIANTTTDANGYYTFAGLSNGNYYLGFSIIQGFQFTGLNSDVNGILGANNSDANPSNGLTECVSLTGNTNINSVDAGIYPGNNFNATSSLGDIVWIDVNNNGLQDIGEVGVSGVTVNLIDPNTNSQLATTITDGLGHYIFTNLDGGFYKVQFSNLPAGYTFTSQGLNIEDENNSDANVTTGMTNTIPLGIGEDKLNVDAGIVAPNNTVCLGDFVWIDLDNDGNQEVGEPAVPGITVKLYENNTNNILQVTTTNLDGKYLFCGLTNGSTYSVGFENLPAGFTFTSQNGALNIADNSDANLITGRTSTITLGATNDLNVDAGIYSPTTALVGNYVWYDENADGIQDVNESPISGVLVTMYDNTNTIVTSAVTDANGKYLFTNVTPGTYTIGFQGYPSNLIPTIKGLNLNADDDSNIDPISGKTDAFIVTAGSSNLTLDAGYKAKPIAGLGNFVWFDVDKNGLQDAFEPPLSGVLVTLYENDGLTVKAIAFTDGLGAYSFPNLEANNYIVGFAPPVGLEPTIKVGALNDSLNSDIDLTFKTNSISLADGTYNPNIDAGFNTNNVLPSREFKAISAILNINNKCDVKWYTVEEENTSNFIIERSIDGKLFDEIGSVKSKGNTNNRTDYLFEDNLVSVDIEKSIYYRIKMVDIDNKYSYSNTLELNPMLTNGENVLIFPNPFKEKLAIKYMASETSEIEIKLRDLNGKTIKLQRSQVDKGYNNIIMTDLEDVSSGQYFIIITDLYTNEEFSKKIVK
jgi:uncharacterized repeat protein (TIGR01451 family)